MSTYQQLLQVLKTRRYQQASSEQFVYRRSVNNKTLECYLPSSNGGGFALCWRDESSYGVLYFRLSETPLSRLRALLNPRTFAEGFRGATPEELKLWQTIQQQEEQLGICEECSKRPGESFCDSCSNSLLCFQCCEAKTYRVGPRLDGNLFLDCRCGITSVYR